MHHIFRVGLSILVSIGVIGLMLHLFTSGMSDQERPSILSALQNTSYQLILVFLALYFVSLFVRTYRYSILLTMTGETSVPSFRQMVLVTGVRNMMVDMLPARIGELSYIALLNRGYGVKLENCASSLAISVAFDFVGLLIIVLMIVAKQLSGAGVEGWAMGGLVSMIILSVVALSGLFLLVPGFMKWLNRRVSNASPPSWLVRLIDFGNQFALSLVKVREAGRTFEVLGLSVLIRLLKYVGFYILFMAVAQPTFESLARLPVEQVVSALIGGEVGASLPLPVFMSFGAYEAGTSLVFSLLGVANQAAAFVVMLCVHIWGQLIEYIIGGVLFTLFILSNKNMRGGLEKLKITSQSSQNRYIKWFAFGLIGIVFLSVSAFLALELRAMKKLGSLSPPASGQEVGEKDVWQMQSKQHVSKLNGFVVFSSNRDGNHDIFKLTLSSFELSKLTTHPHVETYPRLSPNGKRLVFSRSQQPWVSQRNTVAWDVFMLDLETMKETKLGHDGTAPHWVSNNEITYLRERSTLVKIDVDSKQEQIIYQTGVNNLMPNGSAIQNPKYNPKTNQITFTARQRDIGTNTGHWGTAITDADGNHVGVYNGCELAWNSAGDGLYQVADGGRNNGLRIVSVDPTTLDVKTLIDNAGEFSHEYWPKDSSNGEYMVFGASRGPQDHEHDTKDYEIFLWKVGSDEATATRLTFHTGNDNWPDVYIE